MLTTIIKTLRETPSFRSKEADIVWGKHALYTKWHEAINHLRRK